MGADGRFSRSYKKCSPVGGGFMWGGCWWLGLDNRDCPHTATIVGKGGKRLTRPGLELDLIMEIRKGGGTRTRANGVVHEGAAK